MSLEYEVDEYDYDEPERSITLIYKNNGVSTTINLMNHDNVTLWDNLIHAIQNNINVNLTDEEEWNSKYSNIVVSNGMTIIDIHIGDNSNITMTFEIPNNQFLPTAIAIRNELLNLGNRIVTTLPLIM